MKNKPNFLNNQFCLNVLAGSIENAQEIHKVTNGHVIIGVLSKNYATIEEAVKGMKEYSKAINNCVSVGLGAGDPKQAHMVNEILRHYTPQHVNQVFTYVNGARANLNNESTYINCLISPLETIDQVLISTGPISSKADQGAKVNYEVAAAMAKEMGASSIKFFPMNGLKTLEQFRKMCKACVKYDLGIEPTGGIDLENFEQICQVAYDEGVSKIIPHVYSSIIDENNQTNINDVQKLYDILKNIK